MAKTKPKKADTEAQKERTEEDGIWAIAFNSWESNDGHGPGGYFTSVRINLRARTVEEAEAEAQAILSERAVDGKPILSYRKVLSERSEIASRLYTRRWFGC